MGQQQSKQSHEFKLSVNQKGGNLIGVKANGKPIPKCVTRMEQSHTSGMGAQMNQKKNKNFQ